MKTKVYKIVLVLGFVFLMSNLKVNAQYDAMFTQYMHNEMFINPAYTGSKEALNVTILDRQQWLSFPGRPKTRTFSIDGPLFYNKMGIGVSFLNEEIGDLNHNLMYLSYAYRIKTSKKGTLAFGLMGGIHLQSVSLSQVSTIDPGDPMFQSDIDNYGTPNFGFGMYYYTSKFYAGISIPRMVDDNLTFTTSGDIFKHLVVRPYKFHYFITVGRLFRINPNLMLKPQLMLKAVLNSPVEVDITLNALMFERFWLGAAYRSNSDLSAIVGVQITPQFLVSYAYDYPLTSLVNYTTGSHEIVLSYLFSFNRDKIVSPRYF